MKKNIHPIIQQKCIGCHSKENRSSKIDLSHENSYSILIEYVEHQEALAIKSDLIEILLGEEFQAPRILTKKSPHLTENQLSEEEILTFIRWIDLGALQFKEDKSNE